MNEPEQKQGQPHLTWIFVGPWHQGTGVGTQLLLSDLKRRYKGREAEKPLIDRLALHALELTLVHPTTREPLTLRAPLARDFEVALKYLRKFATGKGR